MPDWPRLMHPAAPDADGDGLDVDDTITVEVMQLHPGRVDEFTTWTGGELMPVSGGAVVLLPGDGPVSGRLVGLGDFAVRTDTTLTAEPADGFYARFQPCEAGP